MFNLNTGLLEFWFGTSVPVLAHYGTLLGVLLVSYLLGSINSAILISKVFYHDDIRTKGSGNAGMTNMLRTYGGKAALLTLAGDLGKTVLSIFLAGLFFGFRYVAGVSVMEFCYLAGLFAVIGHIFPVYYKFKGGKGVLVTATMALVLSPIPFLILFLVFAGIVAMSKYVSLGSVSVAVLYPVMISGTYKLLHIPMPFITAFSTILLACIIVYCHRGNLKRINDRTEHKLSFKKKNKD